MKTYLSLVKAIKDLKKIFPPKTEPRASASGHRGNTSLPPPGNLCIVPRHAPPVLHSTRCEGGRNTQHALHLFSIFARAASKISRSRGVRLWMPWAEILS